MNDIELVDEIVKRAEEHQKRKEREFAIEELEKIKEDIDHLMSYYTTEAGTKLKSQKGIFRLIDKHIAELKGENNE